MRGAKATTSRAARFDARKSIAAAHYHLFRNVHSSSARNATAPYGPCLKRSPSGPNPLRPNLAPGNRAHAPRFSTARRPHHPSETAAANPCVHRANHAQPCYGRHLDDSWHETCIPPGNAASKKVPNDHTRKDRFHCHQIKTMKDSSGATNPPPVNSPCHCATTLLQTPPSTRGYARPCEAIQDLPALSLPHPPPNTGRTPRQSPVASAPNYTKYPPCFLRLPIVQIFKKNGILNRLSKRRGETYA